LYHAHFGFTSAFRRFLNEGRGDGIRAQMVMLLVASVLFLPLLTGGSFLGKSVTGFVSPVGTSLLVGAFLFGIGMQVADGRASGTLFHLGGGDLRAILTLVGYVVGSVVGSAHFGWWMSTPHFKPTSLLGSFGIWGGLLLQVVIAGAVVLLTLWMERRRRNTAVASPPREEQG